MTCDPQVDLEGISQNKLPANANTSEEAKLVNWVCSQEPDVLMVRHRRRREHTLAIWSVKLAPD